MIGRRTALVSAFLIALMLVAAVARIVLLDDWPVLANQKALLWLMFLWPAVGALFVAGLYEMRRQTIAADAKVKPWYDWGNRLSIAICAGLLWVQGLLILQSLGLEVPALGSTAGYAIPAAMAIMTLLSINQMPKLPWFESKIYPAGELGPSYGPRYMRVHSRIGVLYWVSMYGCLFVLSNHVPIGIILITAIYLVWTRAVQLHYGRKWKLEQSEGHR
jgi:hypothetical protein